MECTSCGEESPKDECPKSQRPCGHHCNHSWSHDECCWCGQEWGETESYGRRHNDMDEAERHEYLNYRFYDL